MRSPERVYREIRDQYPDQPLGAHWECVGAYLSDDVWGDPDYVDCPGEYELAYEHCNYGRVKLIDYPNP